VGLCAAGYGLSALAATYVLPSILLWLMCRLLARREGELAPPESNRAARVQDHVLRRAALFFGSLLLVQLHARIAQLLLAAFAGHAELGLYGAASKFIEQALMLPAMLSAVLLPAMSRRHADETAARLEQVYFATLLLSLGLAVAFALASEPLVRWILGPEFAAASGILAILALSLPGLYLTSVSGLYYSLNGLELWALLRNLAGLALALVFGLLLIPRHGATGAAWATVASYTLTAFAVEWCAPAFRANVLLKLRALASLWSARSYAALFARMGVLGARQ
jgi:O-antigen/teichoic acid export membrane protein